MKWETPRFHSPEEVAEHLGIKVDTVYRYARKGKLRGVKVGNLWRFAEADVEEFLNRGRSVVSSSGAPPELLPDALRQAAQGVSDEGLVCGSTRRSYAEVDLLSDRLATAFLAKGVNPGDRVVVVLPNTIEFVVVAFAVWKVRAVLVPEYRGVHRDDLIRVLQDAEPAVVVMDDAIAERIEDDRDRMPPLKAVFVKDRTFTLSSWTDVDVESLDAALELETEGRVELPDGASPTDVVSITYTSGSAGKPKSVLHTHESWIAGAAFTRDYHGLEPHDRILIPLPLHHGLAFRQLIAYVLAKGTVVIAVDVYQGLSMLQEGRPTALLLVPAACNILLDRFASVLEQADASLSYVEIGSAPIAPPQLRELTRLLPTTPVHMAYGLTEVRVGFLKRGHDGLMNRIATVAPGLEVAVVDTAGEDVRQGETGEIVIRGRGLMKGYWNESNEEQSVLDGRGFRTGDLGRIDEEGEIELLGRLDDVLEIGERRIIPLELEMWINRHPAVAESAVVGEQGGNGFPERAVHAFVVPRKGSRLEETELLAHCRELLESYEIPSRFHLRNSLPKSPVGKVLRRELQTSIA